MVDKKELNSEELEKVSGGNGYVFTELPADSLGEFINRHVEVHYRTTVYSVNNSHGGTIVEAKGTSGRGRFEVVVKVRFDDWSEGNGWFWWETIWDNKVFSFEDGAKGKSTPADLGTDFIVTGL